MMRTLVLGVCLFGVARVAAAQAVPAGQKIVIAIYAPTAPFDSGDARFQYVSQLAAAIGRAAGVPAEGKAFSRAGDFESAVKKGAIDFAIVDALLLADQTFPRIIATATAGGQTSLPWGLFVGSGGVSRGLDLKGKRLAYVAAGKRDLAFVENGLFKGFVQVSKFFAGKPQSAPDVASAVQTVALGRADGVCVPVAKAKGLKKIFDAGLVPLPGFVQTKASLSDAIVASVTKAVLSYGAVGAFDGWRTAGTDAYRALAGQMSPKQKKPVMVDPDPVKISSGEALLLEAPLPTLPDVSRYFLQPKFEGP